MKQARGRNVEMIVTVMNHNKQSLLFVEMTHHTEFYSHFIDLHQQLLLCAKQHATKKMIIDHCVCDFPSSISHSNFQHALVFTHTKLVISF